MLIFKAPAPGLVVPVQVGYEDVKIIREVLARVHFQARIIIAKAGPCVGKNKGQFVADFDARRVGREH